MTEENWQRWRDLVFFAVGFATGLVIGMWGWS
jgi:hypothetical protein